MTMSHGRLRRARGGVGGGPGEGARSGVQRSRAAPYQLTSGSLTHQQGYEHGVSIPSKRGVVIWEINNGVNNKHAALQVP